MARLHRFPNQSMKTLENLFLDELAEMHDAETRLARGLAKMAKAATHDELREVIQSHLDETELQAKKLPKVFKAFGKEPRGKRCEGIVGLLKEAERIASENKGFPTINAALIAAAQKVEHYEIASYGCLLEWAEQLGNQTAADILQDILEEEKAADQALTRQARERCNDSAQGDDLVEEISPQVERFEGSSVLPPVRSRLHAS
jgi:ferritin-like metal-binding protein YciE